MSLLNAASERSLKQLEEENFNLRFQVTKLQLALSATAGKAGPSSTEPQSDSLVVAELRAQLEHARANTSALAAENERLRKLLGVQRPGGHLLYGGGVSARSGTRPPHADPSLAPGPSFVPAAATWGPAGLPRRSRSLPGVGLVSGSSSDSDDSRQATHQTWVLEPTPGMPPTQQRPERAAAATGAGVARGGPDTAGAAARRGQPGAERLHEEIEALSRRLAAAREQLESADLEQQELGPDSDSWRWQRDQSQQRQPPLAAGDGGRRGAPATQAAAYKQQRQRQHGSDHDAGWADLEPSPVLQTQRDQQWEREAPPVSPNDVSELIQQLNQPPEGGAAGGLRRRGGHAAVGQRQERERPAWSPGPGPARAASPGRVGSRRLGSTTRGREQSGPGRNTMNFAVNTSPGKAQRGAAWQQQQQQQRRRRQQKLVEMLHCGLPTVGAHGSQQQQPSRGAA